MSSEDEDDIIAGGKRRNPSRAAAKQANKRRQIIDDDDEDQEHELEMDQPVVEEKSPPPADAMKSRLLGRLKKQEERKKESKLREQEKAKKQNASAPSTSPAATVIPKKSQAIQRKSGDKKEGSVSLLSAMASPPVQSLNPPIKPKTEPSSIPDRPRPAGSSTANTPALTPATRAAPPSQSEQRTAPPIKSKVEGTPLPQLSVDMKTVLPGSNSQAPRPTVKQAQNPQKRITTLLQDRVWQSLAQLCSTMTKLEPSPFQLPPTATIDLSLSFMKSKDYDWFDLDENGCIVETPRIPIFPEDFPPGKPEWPLSWWGIVDPAIGERKTSQAFQTPQIISENAPNEGEPKEEPSKNGEVEIVGSSGLATSNKQGIRGEGDLDNRRGRDEYRNNEGNGPRPPEFDRRSDGRHSSSRSKERHQHHSQSRDIPPRGGPFDRAVPPRGPGPDGPPYEHDMYPPPSGAFRRGPPPFDHSGPRGPPHPYSEGPRGGDYRGPPPDERRRYPAEPSRRHELDGPIRGPPGEPISTRAGSMRYPSDDLEPPRGDDRGLRSRYQEERGAVPPLGHPDGRGGRYPDNRDHYGRVDDRPRGPPYPPGEGPRFDDRRRPPDDRGRPPPDDWRLREDERRREDRGVPPDDWRRDGPGMDERRRRREESERGDDRRRDHRGGGDERRRDGRGGGDDRRREDRGVSDDRRKEDHVGGDDRRREDRGVGGDDRRREDRGVGGDDRRREDRGVGGDDRRRADLDIDDRRRDDRRERSRHPLSDDRRHRHRL